MWGGQPEILALSRAFETQIHVIQAGVPVLKVGEGEYDGEPLTISYVAIVPASPQPQQTC